MGLVTGGPGKPDGLSDGYYVKPTVFADVNNKMTIAQEEIFGPVLSLIPYDTEQEGIDIANDTIYGLNNAVGSADPERALAVARKLRSGTVMINSVAGAMDALFGGTNKVVMPVSGVAMESKNTWLPNTWRVNHR